MKHHFRPWVLENAQLISALHRFGLNAFQQAVWAGTSSEACRIKATFGNASAIAKAKLRTGSSEAYVITMRDLLQTYDTYHLSCKIFWNDLKSSEQLLWFSSSSLNSEADAFEDQLADLMPETPVAAIETSATLVLFPLHAAILGHTSKKWQVLKAYATTGLQLAQDEWSGYHPRTVFPRPRAAAKCFRLNASESTWQQWSKPLNMQKQYTIEQIWSDTSTLFSWKTTASRDIKSKQTPSYPPEPPLRWTLNWTYLCLSHYLIVSHNLLRHLDKVITADHRPLCCASNSWSRQGLDPTYACSQAEE